MDKKLAVAMFGQKRLSREGGVEIVVKELCTRMARDGYEVTCFNRGGHHVSGAEYDQAVEYKGVRQKTVPTIDAKGLAAVSSSGFAALCSAFAFNTVANIVYMKKYIFDMSLGWIIKVYLANLVAGVLAMCLFGNIVNAHITGFISFFIWAAVVFAGVCLIDVVLNYFFFKNETKTVLYKIGKKLQGKNKD